MLASSADWDGAGVARDGYGMPNWSRISDLDAGFFSAEGPNNGFSGFAFYRTLQAGRTYRIALAWMNGGDYAAANSGRQSQQWSIAVTPPCCGHATVIAGTIKTGQQVLDYTAPVTGSYRLFAARNINNDTNVPNVVGAAVVER
jgi:hypothetical protein